MRFAFGPAEAASALRKPESAQLPSLPRSEVAALYRAARVAGDFFDFLQVGESKLVFVLMDIAGKRDEALHIAAEAQEAFRQLGAALYSRGLEDSDAITKLALELNRRILATADGVCCAPAFLGCYDDEIGTLSYLNAGHTPGVLKDEDGFLLLEANGLPLGLFSHATHEAQFCALRSGAAVILVSKGLVESKGGGEEFGMERVRESLNGQFRTAEDICRAVLNAAQKHEQRPTRFGPYFTIPGFGGDEPNDMTTVTLLRH